MALSKPRGTFAHRRTVRLIVDDDLGDIDALKIGQSLPYFWEDIRGIVPHFGGKCFDITLAGPEIAARLAQQGIDYLQQHKTLTLLGAKTIPVSIFVSVEFPDDDLIKILKQYGELKEPVRLRRLSFDEEDYRHIERGVRVAEFT